MKALITGVTGQDGSLLSDLLIGKGYEVYGLSRRASTDNTQRIQHLLSRKNFHLLEGDILDVPCLRHYLSRVKPDEIYNLAAQSHVGSSYTMPNFTFQVVATGVLNLLEATKDECPEAKFYQASSSEMFGDTKGTVRRVFGMDGQYKELWAQDENTEMLPQSPYGIAKLAAHNMCRVYRQQGMFVCSGILHNHECFVYDTPIIIKHNNKISIKSIYDIALEFANFNLEDNKSGTVPKEEVLVWDNSSWVKIKYISWFKNTDKNIRTINGRNSVYTVTDDHVCIINDQEIAAKDIKVGDINQLGVYPQPIISNEISVEAAELLGMLVGDGSPKWGHFVNSDYKVREKFNELLLKVTGYEGVYYPSTSGFTGEIVGRLDFSRSIPFLQEHIIYTSCKDTFGHSYKCVPDAILNGTVDVMEAFLVGYNVCDGLKAGQCNYRFKNFKTNSPILAQGLLYLISVVTQQKYNITVETTEVHGKLQYYYSINLLSSNVSPTTKYNIVKPMLDQNVPMRVIAHQTGISRKFIQKVNRGYIPPLVHHKQLDNAEIKKIVEPAKYHNDWLFDIETESGTLTAGVGLGRVHNSPRRGVNFVTRKITNYIGQYMNGLTYDKLKLGNLDARRDWGDAEDYVRAMWMMLQYNMPDDYVVSTGETHTVKEFCELAFSYAGMNYKDRVEIDPELYRPTEVHYLLGDSSKIRDTLGWYPHTTFEGLVKKMVDHDINLYKG